MRELRQRDRLRRVIYSVPAIILLVLVTFMLAKGAVKMVMKERESSYTRETLEERTAELVLREQELKEGIERLETLEGVKGEIKERFTVTQEGEYVAVIVDERNASSTSDTGKRPWYKRFWDAIRK